ncbi:MAG: SBBP repeat-containing protein [Sphingobacteriaceae bacterium]|nr:SBBP repeat-containing protein [Sphingobacteriaceae bacterium]
MQTKPPSPQLAFDLIIDESFARLEMQTFYHFNSLSLVLIQLKSSLMKHSYLIICFTIFTSNLFIAQVTRPLNSSIVFTENKGQIHDLNFNNRPDILFSAEAGPIGFHLRNTGISYQLYRVDDWEEVKDLKTQETKLEIKQQTIYRVDLNWLEANSNMVISTDDRYQGYSNYYLENCATGVLNVKSYKGFTIHNLYDGVDLHYYEKNGQLKHDYIVAPFSNYSQIRLKVDGANAKLTNGGGLILSTPLGNVEECKPVVYQDGKELKCRWVIRNNVLSFEIKNYDRSKKLIIDPVTRLWGTYYGGSGNDYAYACAKDTLGNIYMSGQTTSNAGAVIATAGSHQQTFGGGSGDAYLAKFDGGGNRIWATYYGGSGNDAAYSCFVDRTGSVYLAGFTDVSGGTSIATIGSHQQSNGGAIDAFLAKFNSAGTRIWGTYYGGTGNEYAWSCHVDTTGSVFLSGYTNSNSGTVIATVGSHQATYGGGANDAFLAKFNTNGQRIWGTYYGGASEDISYCCLTDISGNVFMTGVAGSGTGIATPGSHQPTYGGWIFDAFLVKFDGNGQRQWGTYYGGNQSDYGNGIAIDGAGNIFLVGYTSSSGTMIATVGSHQQTYGGGIHDAYIAKFNSLGQRLWSTYYGGINTDYSTACAIDASGNIFLTSLSFSNIGDIIATSCSYQQSYGGGAWDGYIVKFSGAGQRQWGTYYGGSSDDRMQFCTADTSGVYVVGHSQSTGTILATPSSYQPSFGGGVWDAFLVKFKDGGALSPTISVNSPVCINNALNFSVAITGTTVPTYSWTGPNSYTAAVQNPVILNTSTVNAGNYVVTLTYTSNIIPGTCIENATTQVIVNVNPTVSVNSGSLCNGNSFTIVPSGANTYTIQGGNSVVSPTVSNSYTVIGTSSTGCISSNTAVCNVTVFPNPTITVNAGSICIGSSFTIVPGGGVTYSYSGGSPVVTPTNNTTYTVLGSSVQGCTNTAVTTISVNTYPIVIINANTDTICYGNSGVLVASGASSYLWNMGSISPTIVVSPSINTNYTVTGMLNGCPSQATQNIDVLSLPIIIPALTPTLICVGETATLNANGALTYSWNPPIPMNSIVSPSFTTTYSVIGTGSNGCVGTQTMITLNVDLCTNTASKISGLSKEILIYPNPFTNIITIMNSGIIELPVNIYDVLGSLIYSSNILIGKSEIDLTERPCGIYFIRIGFVTEKIIKE